MLTNLVENFRKQNTHTHNLHVCNRWNFYAPPAIPLWLLLKSKVFAVFSLPHRCFCFKIQSFHTLLFSWLVGWLVGLRRSVDCLKKKKELTSSRFIFHCVCPLAFCSASILIHSSILYGWVTNKNIEKLQPIEWNMWFFFEANHKHSKTICKIVQMKLSCLLRLKSEQCSAQYIAVNKLSTQRHRPNILCCSTFYLIDFLYRWNNKTKQNKINQNQMKRNWYARIIKWKKDWWGAIIFAL